ncbi:hypothetical protein JIN84_10860 [Luteolibacter yonseiensis]|uniref:Uncharacterized protein n=1 Tax=Luteolibacter yonseiensis TaxID=1144680 RepID=A0A934VAD8_9BACT|nr:hypothetical protein [Luteolibacter yonseiensis]MBK1816113.1 hypothetical protein [Luteolibacter yonseiensis]
MSKLSPVLATAALASLVSCFPPEPMPPPHRPAYGPDYDISPPPPPSRPPESTFSDAGAPPPSTPPPPTANGNFPTATRTEQPDRVLSPYEPYNVIDTTGFKSGQLARDPSNQKIFRVP